MTKYQKIEYIVKYKHYYEVPQHQKILNDILAKLPVSWNVVHRNNPAQYIPSDFSVIRVYLSLLYLNIQINNATKGAEQDVVLKLDSSEIVKYVTPHRRYFGHLNEWEEPDNLTGRYQIISPDTTQESQQNFLLIHLLNQLHGFHGSYYLRHK